MPYSAARARAGRHRTSLYQEITDKIIAELEAGRVPWLTFRQALGLSGNVRKGERGTTVVYADRFTPDEERRRAERDGEEPNAIPFLKRFTVFNTDQCNTWLPDHKGRWFYERARGSYGAAELKTSFRASEKRRFAAETPKEPASPKPISQNISTPGMDCRTLSALAIKRISNP